MVNVPRSPLWNGRRGTHFPSSMCYCPLLNIIKEWLVSPDQQKYFPHISPPQRDMSGARRSSHYMGLVQARVHKGGGQRAKDGSFPKVAPRRPRCGIAHLPFILSSRAMFACYVTFGRTIFSLLATYIPFPLFAVPPKEWMRWHFS